MSWRWVFWVNLPIGVLAAIIIGLALKEPPVRQRPVIDYAGAGLLMLAISLLMLAMVEGGASLATLFALRNVALIGASVVLLVLFVWVENRAPDPIIPFHLFRNKTVAVSIGAGFLGGIAMFGGISFVPLFAQSSLGMSATKAGSLLTPLMLSWVSMSVIGGRLLLKIGYKTITLVGFVVLTIGFAMIATFGTNSPQYWLYIDLILIGAGLGLTMLTLLIAVQQAVERSQLGIATSLNQFSRAIGGAFGVAIMGAVLTAGLAANLQKAATLPGAVLTPEQAASFASNPNALIEPSARSAVPAETLSVLQESMAGAISLVFWLGAITSLLAFVITLFLPAHTTTDQATKTKEACGERMIMAEQTTINARNQPAANERA